MYSDLKTLIELQRIDQQVAALSSQIDVFPQEIQTLEKQLSDFVRAHEERQQRLGASQKERRDLEGEIQLIRQKISKHKDQLFQVKTNEQYRAMLKEIEGEEVNIGSIEDQIIEKMIEAEDLQKQLKEASARLESEKARVAAEKSRLESLAKAGREERERAVQERQKLAGNLDESVRNHYELVRRGRDGVALAEVRNGMCMACNVLLRPQLYNEVRAGESLYECDNCARILYSVEPLPTAAEAGGQPAAVPS
ncbi:MAG TPA: C4-type zinc ribbon domain-containing protein [Terriglobia bacterium]|nr:C4-type zinc ribbon domain-containing protein [Terriglobia bacterium]